MRVRNANRSEVEELNAIAMQAKAHWGYTIAQLELWRESLCTAPQSIEQWPTFVAEEHGRTIGFAQLNPEREIWELVSLFVLPAYMGRGAGKALLQQVILTAQQEGQMTMQIDSDPNAEAFYLACGAVRVGAEPSPIPGDAARVRPQLHLYTCAANLTRNRTHCGMRQ